MRRVDEHEIGILGVGRDAAQPSELHRIELRVWMALNGELRYGALKLCDHGAVLVGIEIEAIRRHQAAGAGVVLDDDVGRAWNEAEEMARYQTGGNVIDAARGGTNEHGDGTTPVELLHRVARGRLRDRQPERDGAGSVQKGKHP